VKTQFPSDAVDYCCVPDAHHVHDPNSGKATAAALAHSRWSNRTATTSADEDFSHIDASLNANTTLKGEVDGHADSQTGAFDPLPLSGRSSKCALFHQSKSL
jgi:hypothetical protein